MIDIAIIGAGPAGLTAAIYGVRAGYKTVVFEKNFSGGQMNFTSEIENFPGFSKISGSDLALKMEDQAKNLGVEFKNLEIKSISKENDIFKIETSSESFEAKKVILSLGASAKTLGIESEQRLRGMGVSYCATCDGGFFKNAEVAVVGGGNTAFEDAVYLSRICKKVYIIHRRDSFRADKVLQEEAKEIENIEFVYNSQVDEILGKFEVDGIRVKNTQNDELKEIPVSGVFVAVGTKPNSELVKDLVETNDYGYIVTDNNMRTSIEGIYAIGDVRNTNLRQIITACADGAIAVNDIVTRKA